ncbi:3-dehydroquinate synthase II [Xanthobacteraceae bacterium Astr-EGSB]|uniref:3-dehydroquinate synthase II n=1 Tax=Astrobacterium formosum TaxID=3069710 RepID=UPI0027B6518A|nr:3-dehydroquinate synthase II [Xanthobacteraceae bacterium Astr-EGSB]
MAKAAELPGLCSPAQPHLDLKEFAVQDISHAGTVGRVCVDTCSHFLPDEGLLVGSFGGRFLLCSSETHPLPYMPTRPASIKKTKCRANANICKYKSYVRGRDPGRIFLLVSNKPPAHLL